MLPCQRKQQLFLTTPLLTAALSSPPPKKNTLLLMPPHTRSKMRADVICAMRWEQRRAPRDLPVPQEAAFAAAYGRALDEYMGFGDAGVGMDLTTVRLFRWLAGWLMLAGWVADAGWLAGWWWWWWCSAAAAAALQCCTALRCAVDAARQAAIAAFSLPDRPLLPTPPPSSIQTQDLHPPKDACVKVRVLRSHGSMALSHSAKVALVKGSVHSMQCSEAEPLIRKGVLQVLDGNV